MNVENLKLIIRLAKECNQKRFSELDEIHQQAALVVGDIWKVSVKNGKIVQDTKEGGLSALCANYPRIKQALMLISEPITGMSHSSMLIEIDQPLPPTTDVTFQEAVELFPSWNAPARKEDAAHLPPAKLPNTTRYERDKVTNFNYWDIGVGIAQTIVAIKCDMIISKQIEAIIGIAHKYPEEFAKICQRLGLDPEPIFQTLPREDLPRGSITYSKDMFPTSYVATYVALAYQGKFLRAEVNI